MSTLKATNIKNESSASNNIVLDSGGGVVVSGILTATTFSGDGSSLTGVASTENVSTNSLVVAGVTTVSAGSTSAPSITPSGDPNTGVFFPAADTIAFAEGGAEVARFDSSGRLLVGTSTNRTNYALQLEGTNYNQASLSLTNNQNTGNSGYLTFGKSRGATVGSNTIVNANDPLGIIEFSGADGNALTIAALIRADVDGTPGTNDMPGRLVFSTTADGASSPTERMRIKENGSVTFGATDDSPSFDTGVKFQASTNSWNIVVDSPNGGSSHLHLYNLNATNNGYRFYVNSNGGIANYSASNTNLSDRNVKKDISPAAGTWGCLKQWEIVNYRYKDQPDDADLNLGVIAQQVAESCPEVITIFQQATENEPEKLGVKEQQMYWMAIKALQEAQERIETLEAQNAAILARLDAAGL